MSEENNEGLESANLSVEQQSDDTPGRRKLTAIRTEWSGPLPPPQILQRYEEIVPGAADRILKMTEKQMNHRIDLEKTVIKGDSKRSYLGLIAGFIVAISAIGGAIYLAANGHGLAGGVIGGSATVGLASVFVYGSNARRAERKQKDQKVR